MFVIRVNAELFANARTFETIDDVKAELMTQCPGDTVTVGDEDEQFSVSWNEFIQMAREGNTPVYSDGLVPEFDEFADLEIIEVTDLSHEMPSILSYIEDLYE